MCRHFQEDYGLEVRVARYHNIYGPYGTYDGGREKAPAALCRKVILAKKENLETIDVWGDGQQTRTFLYVDECVEGTLRLFESNHSDPINIGSDEQVSINQMIEMIENISVNCKCESSQVNIKATTTEMMGFIGRSEGIAAQCSCLIESF